MRWIPVSERLPTHPYSVLGFVVEGGLARAGDPMRDIVSYFPEWGKWKQNVGDDDATVGVSHWMDLPDPPMLGRVGCPECNATGRSDDSDNPKACDECGGTGAVPEPIGINGLTEAETSATASVLGLTASGAKDGQSGLNG